jgi:hypothetical protein
MAALIAYLRLRGILISRLLRELGWPRLVVLGFVLVTVVGRALVMAASHPQAQWLVPLATVALLASAHRQRDDFRFLIISAPQCRQWLAVEFLLWALPIATLLLVFQDWGAVGLTLAVAPFVALVPPVRAPRGELHRARSVVRSEAFEWVSGLRAGGALAWAVLLAGALWQHEAPIGPVLALGAWLLVAVAYYGLPEPLTMLALDARTPRQFLRRRLLLGLGYSALSASPFLWLLGTGPAGWGGAVVVALVWLGLVTLIILTKYAFYPNALHIRSTQGLVVCIAMALPGHPAYPVLMLVAAGGLIWQSQRCLRAVLRREPTFD